MKQLYITEIIKTSKSFVVVALSSEGNNYIESSSLYYIIEKSIPKTDDMKVRILDIVFNNKKFHEYMNKNGIDQAVLSINQNQFSGYLTNDYAIIDKKYLSLLIILSEVDTIKLKSKKLIIAVDGNSTAGKTTLSNRLKDVYDCNVFHIDDFFKKPDQNKDQFKSSYANNINFNRLKDEVFTHINQEDDVLYRPLDLSTHQLKEPILIPYKSINIIEGAFSMHPEIIDFYDLKIFMKARYSKQLRRIYKRNGFKKMVVFIKKWIPNENRYFKDLNIKNQADLIVELKHF